MDNTGRKNNTSLAAKLIPRLPAADNSVICPHGIAAVLAMAVEGASGESLDEILFTLGFRSIDELRCSITAALHTTDVFKSKNTITLMKGNRGTSLLERFKQSMRTRYLATVNENDTNGMLSVEFCNTASFRAEWLRKMGYNTSKDLRFHNADGSCCHPAYLNCTAHLRCYKDKDIGATIKAVALPYKSNDENASFDLVLVDSEILLTETLLTDIFANMREDKCEVIFPEFSIKSEFDLVPVMKVLGLKKIFDAEKGTFDRIATEPLYAKTFEQKAEIQVDKHGTVAKAITCMVMSLKSGVATPVDKFAFTRPFHYFLRNVKSGEILFVGKVNQLTAYTPKTIRKAD